MTTTNKTCPTCGKAFYASLSVFAQRVYCSRRCRSSDPEQFWNKTDRSGDCWLWTKCINSQGYGVFMRGPKGASKSIRAHRQAWELINGPIPQGLEVCHSCDNPRCVRPEHLFLGTHQDNMDDMFTKGRAVVQTHPEKLARGEQQGKAKLTVDNVREIRSLHQSGLSTRQIGDRYGVNSGTIHDVVHYRTWRHVE